MNKGLRGKEMKLDTAFVELTRQLIYLTLYNTLKKMEIEKEALKAFEEYKKADLQGIQTAGAWVREWQQAKVSEIACEEYMLEKERRRQQAELFALETQINEKLS